MGDVRFTFRSMWHTIFSMGALLAHFFYPAVKRASSSRSFPTTNWWTSVIIEGTVKCPIGCKSNVIRQLLCLQKTSQGPASWLHLDPVARFSFFQSPLSLAGCPVASKHEGEGHCCPGHPQLRLKQREFPVPEAEIYKLQNLGLITNSSLQSSCLFSIKFAKFILSRSSTAYLYPSDKHFIIFKWEKILTMSTLI